MKPPRNPSKIQAAGSRQQHQGLHRKGGTGAWVQVSAVLETDGNFGKGWMLMGFHCFKLGKVMFLMRF